MADLNKLKQEINTLTPAEKLELGAYATSEGTKEKQAAEGLELLNSFPAPITDSDRAFIEKHKKNKNIKRDKIKFTETTIELDGLKFPRTIAKYDDIKNTSGLQLDKNVYQKDGHDYFTFDAVKQLGKAGHKVPSKDQWQQASDVFGRYGLLGQLLNYPKPGVRRSHDSRVLVGSGSSLWSSTPHDGNTAYSVWFDAGGSGDRGWDYQYDARSLVFLQD